MSAPLEVVTIGHSNHSIEQFAELLLASGVNAVADVRSSPYSQFLPQFNREIFALALKECRISYSFLGKELGGRPEDRSCYENGRVRYSRVAATSAFRSGLERVIAGARQFRIALVCAEREPLECHRCLLVAPELEAAGVRVVHVHADGSIEPHSEAMSRLLELHGLSEQDLFRSRPEMIEEACFRQQERFAFAGKPLSRQAAQ